ncbi:MAG: hypothetical protein KC613_09225 [Myxococcales bacterium]|nr:hypothetical protein [Myxococcales bacterium]MCB9521762.1 hypothetical protein [Myxococcales bacterium]
MKADKEPTTTHAESTQAHDEALDDATLDQIAAERAVLLKGLLPVTSPAYQAEMVLRANGVEVPQAVLAEVEEFEVDHAGQFQLVLRREVSVGGLTFERVIRGQGGAQRLEQLSGVRDGAGPVRTLKARRDGGLAREDRA